MEILFAAGHLPASRGRQAGEKVSYYFCEYLARHHNLHLLAFANSRELADLDRADLKIFASCELISVTNKTRLLGALSAPLLPLAVSARNSGLYRTAFRKLVRERQPKIAIFDHTAMFQYAAETPASVVTVGCVHDICTQAWRRKVMLAGNPLTRLLLGMESLRIERWEKEALAALDFVTVLNEKDKKLFESLVLKGKAIVIDPWIVALRPDAPIARERGSILFWGAMDRAENADAARWAAKEILPLIRRNVPNAKLYIGGNHGERLAPEFAGREDIVITGFVEDVGSLMSRMDIALLPLRLGAGIKIKTLECMAAGLPVVTSSVGAEGVGGEHGIHYLVSDVPDAIAAHAIELLNDSKLAREMGARAKEFITQSRDFAGRMRNVEDALIQAVSERQIETETTGIDAHLK